MERLPIKFFSKREEDKMRVEGGGDDQLPGFVLSGNVLSIHADNLLAEMEGVCNKIQWDRRNGIPFVFCAKMSKEALAKSHRGKIDTLFAGNGQDNVIGLVNNDTLLVMLQAEQEVNEICKRIRMPEEYAYGISCIEEVHSFKPHFTEGAEVEDYKIKLIDFQNFSVNEAFERRFENAINNMQIEYAKTEYATNLKVYKLRNLTKAKLDEIERSDIYDLALEISPIPKISISFDTVNDERLVSVKEPSEDEKSTVVGVLDNGIAPIVHLKPWITGRRSPYPDKSIEETHGTYIAGIITYGDELQMETLVGAENIKVFDAAIFPNLSMESIDEDDLINNIKEIVRAKCQEIKIWNLSISIMREISDNKFSDFAIALDSLQDECNVLICKSAGNCKNFAIGMPVGRLHEGADSVRSLVIGSLASNKKGIDISEPDNPSPFTRIGPGPSYIVKPDLVHYGGNAGVNKNGEIVGSGIYSFSKSGSVVTQVGTSFSTPRVSALAAGIYNAMDEEFDPILIKALLIHSASYPKNITLPINERTKYTGFGLPGKVADILYNSPYEATLILRDSMSKGGFIDIKDFPMPSCLCKSGYYRGQIIATLVYDPIIEPSQGAEYCQSNMEVRFGSYDEKVARDTMKRNILNPVGRGGSQNLLLERLYSKRKMIGNKEEFAKKERLLIQYGDKYYPVKKYAVDLSELTDGNKIKFLAADKKWFLTMDGVYRNFSEKKASANGRELSQEFCLILTVRDPLGKEDVYTGVTQKLDDYNFWHSNIKINTEVSVHL